MLNIWIKALLKRMGIIAVRQSSRVYLPEDESYRIVASLVGCKDPVVFDGGAHLGDVPDQLGALLPDARFFSFEPDPELGAILEQRFQGNAKVKVIRAALGDTPGWAKFNLNASKPTNSLLPASDSLQADLKTLCQLVEQVDVEVVTIDDFCRKSAIDRVDVLKLDLQGYDYLALKGASDTLKKAKVVLVEVLFVELYQGAHGFPDILNLMLERGFKLHTLCGLHYGESNELMWADAIFVPAATVASKGV
ncbi:FkbM family methyltransferase [Ferriphaselus sp. R-1]|uniref:FkbM family methyltransferase n=1 Tax=Ferriphaselus sp. R-1 TaxID=1485544 RepID=UPI0005564A1C|nr:FkbM family methyltransferase [Ferriphaselus sp. R-1]